LRPQDGNTFHLAHEGGTSLPHWRGR